MNPNPNCADECRFRVGGGMTTCAYYPPVYDKHGNNTNPDGNTTTGDIWCTVCGGQWYYATQYGKTTFREVKGA